jgi:hypothetical protein
MKVTHCPAGPQLSSYLLPIMLNSEAPNEGRGEMTTETSRVYSRAKANNRHAHLKKAVIANAKWIDKTLWVGMLLCGGIILLRLFGGSKVPFVGISFPMGYSWIPILILTFAHGYATILLRRSAKKMFKDCSEAEGKEVWNKVVTEGGLFMRGMEPRLIPQSGRFAPMINEPSAWTSHIGAVLLLVAAIPWKYYISWQTVFAFAIVYANWHIGSGWAISLSELSTSKENAVLLAR